MARLHCGHVVLLLLASAAAVNGDISLKTVSGDEIVNAMPGFTKRCSPITADGQHWAPLPAGTPCGKVDRCDFPDEWCAFKPGADGNPDLGSLNCQPLQNACRDAFKEAAAGNASAGETDEQAGNNTSQNMEITTEPSSGNTSSDQGSDEGALIEPPGPSEGNESSPDVGGGMPPPPPGDGNDGNTSAVQPEIGGGLQPVDEGNTTSAPPEPEEGNMTAVAPETDTGMPSEAENTTAAGGETSPGPQAAAGASPGECCDYHEFCCFWASTNQCQGNKPFMARICQKSCGTCGCAGNGTCEIRVDPSCSGGDKPSGTACPCKRGDAVDKDWHTMCRQWAARGDCETNAAFMKGMCKLSCDVCK